MWPREVLKSPGKDCTGFVAADGSDYTIFKGKIQGIEAEMSVYGYFHGMQGIREETVNEIS